MGRGLEEAAIKGFGEGTRQARTLAEPPCQLRGWLATASGQAQVPPPPLQPRGAIGPDPLRPWHGRARRAQWCQSAACWGGVSGEGRKPPRLFIGFLSSGCSFLQQAGMAVLLGSPTPPQAPKGWTPESLWALGSPLCPAGCISPAGGKAGRAAGGRRVPELVGIQHLLSAEFPGSGARSGGLLPAGIPVPSSGPEDLTPPHSSFFPQRKGCKGFLPPEIHLGRKGLQHP